METEIWVPVAGWEQEYEVSNMGRVRRPARILETYPDKDGFPAINFRSCSREKLKQRVHHLVLEAFAGPSPYANRRHRRLNGDRQDNRAENLVWAKATMEAGEKHENCKLSEASVVDIRAELAAGAGVKATARKFGVSPKTVRDIRDGKTWKTELAPVDVCS